MRIPRSLQLHRHIGGRVLNFVRDKLTISYVEASVGSVHRGSSVLLTATYHQAYHILIYGMLPPSCGCAPTIATHRVVRLQGVAPKDSNRRSLKIRRITVTRSRGAPQGYNLPTSACPDSISSSSFLRCQSYHTHGLICTQDCRRPRFPHRTLAPPLRPRTY